MVHPAVPRESTERVSEERCNSEVTGTVIKKCITTLSKQFQKSYLKQSFVNILSAHTRFLGGYGWLPQEEETVATKRVEVKPEDIPSVDKYEELKASYPSQKWRIISRPGGATMKPADFYRLNGEFKVSDYRRRFEPTFRRIQVVQETIFLVLGKELRPYLDWLCWGGLAVHEDVHLNVLMFCRLVGTSARAQCAQPMCR